MKSKAIVSATLLDADTLLVDAIDQALQLGQILQTDGRVVAMAPKLLSGFTQVVALGSQSATLQ